MKLAEAEKFVYEEVAKYTYKPDNIIDVWPIRTNGEVTMVEIGLRRFVDDSRGATDEKVIFGVSKTIALYALKDDEFAKEYVQWTMQALIREAEMHEAHEWLKYDGVMVADPHEEGRL
jgi:hypothetical protein